MVGIVHACSKCEREFSTPAALVTHVEKVHPQPKPGDPALLFGYLPCEHDA